MERMKKRSILACLLLCLLAACAFAGAEEGEEAAEAVSTPRKMMTLSGTVVAGETKAVLAPFGGTVREVSLRAGDMVTAGETLFTLETQKVYAPRDGYVGSLGARVGDEASYYNDLYGGFLYIEPLSHMKIETDTTYAYNESANKIIHIGEAVFIGSRNSSERMGTGVVTAVDGENFTVEVTEGNLAMGDGVSIYRTHDFQPDSKIASGTTSGIAYVPITGDGSIYKLYVEQGQQVARGDLLAELVEGSIAFNTMPTNLVNSGYHAIVATVDVQAGQSVSKDGVMATLHPIEELQIAVDVPEADLRNIEIGGRVRIEFVSYFDQDPIEGVINAISGLNSAEEGEAKYTAYIDFAATDLIRLGMNANIYINE